MNQTKESWSGTDKATALQRIDELGYPVIVNGEEYEKKVGAMAAVNAAPDGEEIVVSRV